MASPKRRPPPPAYLTVPRILKTMHSNTLLSTLLSLGVSEEEQLERHSPEYELEIVVTKEQLSIERTCNYYYFRSCPSDSEDATPRSWPVLIRNTSLIVKLADGVPAIPYYLSGLLVCINLAMSIGVVRIKITTTSGVIARELVVPLYRIFLLEAPRADYSIENLLIPKVWKTIEASVAHTLTNAQIQSIARAQLKQEHQSGHDISVTDHANPIFNAGIFATVGESQPVLQQEQRMEDASAYKDSYLLQNIKAYLTHAYWLIQRQIKRPPALKRALNTLLQTHASFLVCKEQDLLQDDLDTNNSSFIPPISKRSTSVLGTKEQSALISQVSLKSTTSLAQTGMSNILKRSANHISGVPKALSKLTDAGSDAGEHDLTMTQLQNTSIYTSQKSPMRSQSQLVHNTNPILRTASPILPARRGHVAQTAIAGTKIPLLPSTTKVDSRVIKMTQILNALIDETNKGENTHSTLLDDVVHDPERDFKQEITDNFYRHMSALEEEFFLSVTAAHRRYQARFCSVLEDTSHLANEYGITVPKLCFLRPSLYLTGKRTYGLETAQGTFLYDKTLPLGLCGHKIPTVLIYRDNLVVYGDDYVKRKNNYISVRQDLSSQIRFQPCYIEHALSLVKYVLTISEKLADIFLDLETTDIFNIRSCNLTINKDGSITIGPAHQLFARKPQIFDYTTSVEESLCLFIQYIDTMIAKVSQYNDHIKFFEGHALFESRVDYFCNLDQMHDTRKRLSIEFATLRNSEDPSTLESVINKNQTIFIKILKYFLFYNVTLVPYATILNSILIYYQYLHTHLITKLEKDSHGSNISLDQQQTDGSGTASDIMAALATVKLYDATRIYFTVARMMTSALNDLAERTSYKVFLLALKPLNEFQFSEQGMENISTLEDLSLIASRMYSFGFSRFDFIHNAIFPQKSTISFVYGADQQALKHVSNMDGPRTELDSGANGNRSPEESFNPDNQDTSVVQGDEIPNIKTVHKKRNKLQIQTDNEELAKECASSMQQAIVVEDNFHAKELPGSVLAKGDDRNYLVSVPSVTSSIGYHYSFFDIVLTFMFNFSISVVLGISWTCVESTPLDNLFFGYFANYMSRYSRSKFILAIQEQNLRFQLMAGEQVEAAADLDKERDKTQDELTEEPSASSLSGIRGTTNRPAMFSLFENDDNTIETYDHEIADMYLDLPIVLMGNNAVISNRHDAPNTSIGNVKIVVSAELHSRDSADYELEAPDGILVPEICTDFSVRQEQHYLTSHNHQGDASETGYGANHADILATYVTLLTHKKLSLLTIKERGVVTRLELSDRAKEFSCLLDLTQDLFVDDFNPTALMTKYKTWFANNKQIETLLSFDYENRLKIKDVNTLLLFSDHDVEFPMLDFETPREIIDKLQTLRAIIAVFPTNFYASMFTVSVQHMCSNLLEAIEYLERHMMEDLTEAIKRFTNYILSELSFVSSVILSATTTPEKFQLVRDLHNRFSDESSRRIFSSLYDRFIFHYGRNYITLFSSTYDKQLITLLEEPSRQFLRLSLLAKKHSQSITDRINSYADYVIAVDQWIAQMAFSIADGLKIIFTIDYPSFREARNAPLTFAEKYPLLCKNFELKLLNLDTHQMIQDQHKLDIFSSEQDNYAFDGVSTSDLQDSEPHKTIITKNRAVYQKPILLPSNEDISANTLAHAETLQNGDTLRTSAVPDVSYSLHTAPTNTVIFERNFIQSLVVACRLELHTKRISYNSLIRGFHLTDSSETANNQRIVCIQNGILDSVSSKIPGNKYIFSTAKLYKRPVHKTAAAYQRNVERYDMRRILSEYKFLLVELCALIRLIDRWRIYLLAADCSTKLLEVPVYPSPFAMLRLLAPIADISITLYDIDSCHNHYSEKVLRSYPHVELLMAIDRVVYSIRQARYFAETPFVDVHTNKVEIQRLIDNIIRVKYKDRIPLTEHDGKDLPFLTRIKEMPDTAFSISFEPWIEYLDNAENVLLLFIPPISLLHQISSSTLRPIHLQRITSLTGVFVEKSLSVKPQLLLDAFEKNNELLDFVLVLVQNSSIDKEAIQELKQIERALYSIRIDATYPLRINGDMAALDDKASAWKNFIEYAVITPANAEEICRESLITISLILNNLGYTGTRSIDYTQSFDVTMASIASKSSLLTARYLSPTLETHRQYLQQWRYMQNVEEYARDLEAMAQLTLFMVTIFKRMPFLLNDLLTYQANANVINFHGPKDTLFTPYHRKIIREGSVDHSANYSEQTRRKFGGAELSTTERNNLATRLKEEQRKRAFSINFLSKQDITTLQMACAAWKDTITKYCSVEETIRKRSVGARILKNLSFPRSLNTSIPFICVIININVIKSLSRHILEIDAIHKRLHFYQDFPILQLFQQQTPKDADTTRFTPYYSIKTSNPDLLSIGPKRLVPWNNGKLYPSSFFCSSICQVFCGEFPRRKSLFKLVTSLSYEVFHGMDEYITDSSSIRGTIISGIRSADETLMFTTPVEAPNVLYLVPDAVAAETRASFIDAVKNAFNEFAVAYMKFVGKGLNNEAPPAGFFNYLQLEQMAKSVSKESQEKDKQFSTDEDKEKNKQQLISSVSVKDPEGFTEYLKNNLYRAVIISISTWLFQKTREFLIQFVANENFKCDFITELLIFLQNFLLAIKINSMQKSPIYVKVFMQQLIEWYEYYQDLNKLIQRGDFKRLIHVHKSIPFTIYDPKTHNLVVTTPLGEFVVPYGPHWIGAPNGLDLITSVSLPYRYAMTVLINGFSMGIPAFILTSANRSIYAQEPMKVAMQVCHLLGRRLISICFAEFTFAKCLQRLTACLCAGYVVVIFGLQYLPIPQIMELVSLANGLRRKSGPIETFCVPRELSPNEKKKATKNKMFFGSSELNYLHSQITITSADFSDFSDHGFMIFHLPELAPIITADKFYFEQKQEEPTEQEKEEPGEASSKDMAQQAISGDMVRVQDSYSASYRLTVHGRECIAAFKHAELVYLEFDQPESSFKKVSPEYYHVFCELNNFLASMGQLSCKLLTSDIQIIYSRAKDKTDASCVAAITLDYILRQSVQFFSLGATRAEIKSLNVLYSQFVCAAFGLDKMNATHLSRLARNFLGTIESARMHLGLKYAETGDKYTTDRTHDLTIKQVSFAKYYTESLSRYLSQQFQWYLNMFSQAHQLSFQTVYDVLFCNDLLRSFKPVLVVIPQISYLKTFASIIAAVRGWRMHYCFNAASIYSTHKAIQAIDLNDSISSDKTIQEHLIIIAPSNVSAFLQMFEIILSVSLGYPVLTDDKNLSQVQLDVSHGPHYLLIVSPDFLPEIVNYQCIKAICHRLILIPSIEGADGSKKICQGSLYINEAHLLKLVQRNYSLWKRDLDANLENMEYVNQYGEDPATPLSRALENIVTSYRSIILQSALKDRLLRTAERRIAALPTFIKGVFSFFYDLMIKTFGYGRSIEEVYLLRSIVYFNLYRSGVVTLRKRRLQSDFLKNVCASNDRFDQSTTSASIQRISEVAAGKRARDVNAMTRILGAQYIALTQTQAQAVKGLRKKDDPFLLVQTNDPVQLKRNQLLVLGNLMQSRVRVSDDLYPFSEIAGFSKDTLIGLETKIKRLTATTGTSANIPEIINTMLLLNAESDIIPFGLGFQGSTCYIFAERYLREAFFQPKRHVDAFTNISTPFFCAIWNACSLFYLTFTANGNWDWLLSHGPKTAQDLLSKKYTKVITELSEVQKVSQGTFCSLIAAIVLILSEAESPPSSLRHACFSNYTVSQRLSVAKLNHGLTNEQLMTGIRSTMQEVVRMIPKHMSNDTFSYLDYKLGFNKDKKSKHYNQFHTRIEFRVYAIGEGLLSNLVLDADRSTLEKNVIYVAEKTLSLRKKKAYAAKLAKETGTQEKSGHGYSDDDDDDVLAREITMKRHQRREKTDINEIILDKERGDRLSLHTLLDTPIYFDSHRAALLVILGCAMLSPISLALVGDRGSGKTILLDAAKLLVRDLVDSNMILLSDLHTESTTFSVLTGITQKFILRSAAQSSMNRYGATMQPINDADSNVIFDYYSTLCFPSFHLHCSDCQTVKISEHLALLLRDHVILMDISETDLALRSSYSQEPTSTILPHSIYPETLQGFTTGCASLSDCSFILECDSFNQKLSQCAALAIQMPPLTEHFLRSLFLRTYPKHSESWVFQFINGYFLIKGSLPPSLINSFTVFDRLKTYSSFLMKEPDSISDEMLATIESYPTMGKNPGRLPPNSITEILKANKDSELGNVNIHALFGSLRNLSETSLLVLQTIIERFASLSILGYLDEDNDAASDEQMTALYKQQMAQRTNTVATTPWSDARLLVKGNFILTTAWERYILDQAINYMATKREQTLLRTDNTSQAPTSGSGSGSMQISVKITKRDATDAQQAQFNLGNQFMIDTLTSQHILETDLQDSPLKIVKTISDRQLLLLMNYRNTNTFWFAHLMSMVKLYGQDLDPFITCRALEAFLVIFSRRELNLSKLNCLLKYGISVQNRGSMSLIFGEDPILPARLHILKQASLFSARILAYIKSINSDQSDYPNSTAIDDPQTIASYLCSPDMSPEDRSIMMEVINDLEGEIKVAEDMLQQEHEDADYQVHFDGLPLLTMLSMKPNKVIIRIDNAPSSSYNQLVRLFAAFGNYTILSSDRFKQALDEINKAATDEDLDDAQSEVSKGSSRSKLSSMSGTTAAVDLASGGKKNTQQRILVDVTTILSHLDGQTIMRTKKPPRGGRKEAKENVDLIENLKKMMAELQSTSSYNSDMLDFLALIMILRISFGMALGIKPELLLTTKASAAPASPSLLNLGFNINSALMTSLPSRVIGTGRGISQLPLAVSSWPEYVQKIEQYSRILSEDHINLDEVDVAQQANEGNEGNKQVARDAVMSKALLHSPVSVLIVAPMSTLMRASPTGVTAYTLLCRSLEPLNILQSIFDEEEVQCLCNLTTFGLGLDIAADSRVLVSILSLTLSIVIIDDFPLNCSENVHNEDVLVVSANECMRAKVLGSIKSPILELVPDLTGLHKAMIMAKAAREAEVASKSKLEDAAEKDKKLSLVQPQIPDAPLQITNSLEVMLRKRLQECNYNIITMSKLDLLSVFQLSDCKLPTEVVLPAKVSIDWEFFHHSFMVASIGVYRFCSANSVNACPSMAVFTLLAAQICNLLLNKAASFMSILNTFFIALRLYEALASPSKTKPKLLDVTDLSPELIAKIVDQALKAQLSQEDKSSDSTSKRQRDLITAIAEAVVMRDLIYTCIDVLKTDFRIMASAARSAALDSVAIAASLLFSIPGLILESTARDALMGGVFGDNSLTVLKLLDQSVTNPNICCFNLMIVALYSSLGFNVELPNMDERKFGFDEDSPIPICNSTLQYGRFAFIGHLIEILGADWPMLTLLKGFRIPWSMGDPALLTLYSVAIRYITGSTVFCVDETMSLAAACFLEACKKQNAQGTSFYEQTNNLILYGLDNANPNLKDVTDLLMDLQKRVLIIDMRMPPREFSTVLARGLSTGEYTLLFINVESLKTNTSNYTTLRKFMILRARRTITKRQTISIGSVTAITAQALHKYTIIFSLGRGMNLSDVLINMGLFTQQFINDIAVCTQYSLSERPEESDTESILLQGQKQIMSQVFLEAIFGESEGIRSRNERYRLNNIIFSYLVSNCSEQLKNYLMVHVLNLSVDKVMQIGSAFVRSTDSVIAQREMEQAAMNQMVTQLTGSSDSIQHVCFTASFLLHASSSRKSEINQVLDISKQMIILQQERYSMLSRDRDTDCDFVDTEIKVRCIIFDIVNTYGQALCDDIALAVNAIIYFLRKTSQFHLPAFIGYSRDFFLAFRAELSRAVQSFKTQLKDKYSKDLRFQSDHSEEYMQQHGLVHMQDKNILAFCIKYDPGTLKGFLTSVMIPMLENRLFNIFPPELSAGMWHLIHALFLTAIGDLSGISKERPYPINPCKENVTAPALSLFAILRSSVKDIVTLLTTQQIMGAAYPRSKFALTKIDADNADATTLSDIKHIIPEVTSMSPKVIMAWIFFCLLGRYNPVVSNSLTWFLKHHAAFVCFSKCEQPFASVLAFYTRNNMAIGSHSADLSIRQTKDTEKRGIQQQWYAALMRDAMASNYQVFKLPPMLAKQDNQSFFAMFSLATVLKPELIIETFEAMAIMQEKRCGPSAWQLVATKSINAEKGITALVKSDMKVSSNAESSELLRDYITSMGPAFRNILMFAGLPTKTSIGENIEMPMELVSDCVFQLYDVYLYSFKATERYFTKVCDINNNKQILKERKMQHIMALGPSPVQLSIIFYDRIISIDHIFTFIHTLLANPHRAIRANFVKNLTFQDITESITVIFADPLLSGVDLLKDVVNVLKQKLTIRKYDLVYPIFLFIPSSPLMPSALKATQSSLLFLTYAESEQFSNLLYEISILTVPNYIYIQHPNTLKKAFVHYFNLSMIAITLLITVGFKVDELSKIPNFVAPVTMRGVVLFILKYALLTYQSTTFMDDSRIFYKIKKVLLLALTKQAQSYDSTSFISCAYSNYILLKDKGILPLNQIDMQQYNRIDSIINSLNFGKLEALSKIIPTKLVISELQVHDEVVIRLLKESMRAKAQKDAKRRKLRMAGSSESEGDELSESNSIECSSISMESSTISTKMGGAESEAKEGEFIGFDDGDSLAGSDNMSSRGSSVTARSRGTSILRNNQGPQSLVRFGEDDIYESLLVTIQIAAGDLSDERPIEAKKIETSIRKLVEIEHRSLNVVDVPNLALESAGGTARANKFSEWIDIRPFYNELSDIIDFVQQLGLYNHDTSYIPEIRNSDDQHTSKRKRRLISIAQSIPPQEFFYRHLFSSQITLNTLSTVANPNFPSTKKIYNDARKQDLSKMTASLRTYITSHEGFKYLQFGSFSRSLPALYTLKHIIPNVGLPDMFTVDGTVGFGTFPTHWIINVTTYGPILGDIFNFVRMHASILTSTPINRQRIVVSIKKPLYTPQIKEDGTIDTDTKSGDHQSPPPFYVVLRNLELFGICYDTVLETVCAYTVERANGYDNCMELYAYCVIINNATAKTCTLPGSTGGTYLRVPANMVPVPIKVGGRTQPIVYLPNKTSISSEEWLGFNPFFGIRAI